MASVRIELDLPVTELLQVRVFDDSTSWEELNLHFLVLLAFVPVGTGRDDDSLHGENTAQKSKGDLDF